ncbi:MAG: hypothetical protein WA136_00045 [Rhodoferax sp.]
MKIALRIAFLLFVVVPFAAWFIVKPVRVIVPTVIGMQCASKAICVEATDKLPEATALYNESLAFVGQSVGPIQGRPLVVFCSTQNCANQFGLGARSAVTVGTIGTVIGPNAWKDYYVRHELIHHLQGQQFGVFRRILMPSWLIEGMAYSLSADSRAKLAEPWQQYRDQFNKWLAMVGRENMWNAASSL